MTELISADLREEILRRLENHNEPIRPIYTSTLRICWIGRRLHHRAPSKMSITAINGGYVEHIRDAALPPLNTKCRNSLLCTL